MCPAFRARPHAPFDPVGVAVPRPAAVRRRRRRRFFHSLVSRGQLRGLRPKRPRTGEQGRSFKLTPGACTRPLAGAWWGAAEVRQMPRGAIRQISSANGEHELSSRASPGVAQVPRARERSDHRRVARARDRRSRAGARARRGGDT
jgi:hypothetical protein